jgi:hypothetical protein
MVAKGVRRAMRRREEEEEECAYDLMESHKNKDPRGLIWLGISAGEWHDSCEHGNESLNSTAC